MDGMATCYKVGNINFFVKSSFSEIVNIKLIGAEIGKKMRCTFYWKTVVESLKKAV